MPILKNARDIEILKLWFLDQRRDLPWRNAPSPYAVWVSEVMLQQTQVSVVIPYFERWMELFPTIQDLAKADLDAVIKEWEGLGYYSRARNLHQGARYIVEHFNGVLPDSSEQLQKIKGLGVYTIGAILSFAFHQRKAAVDGNVVRVIARYYGIEDDIAKAATQKNIHSLAQDLLPEKESWIVSEALIELGATVCNRKPKCMECPLKRNCRAFASGAPEQLPFKSTKIAITKIYRAVAALSCQGHFLVRRGSKGKLMSDLYEFPYFELDSPVNGPKSMIQRLYDEWGVVVHWEKSLPRINQSFTRFRAQLFPHHLVATELASVAGYQWVAANCLKDLPFSSGHRRILNMLF